MNLVVKEKRSVDQMPRQKAGKACVALAIGYYCSRFVLFNCMILQFFVSNDLNVFDCLKLQKNMHVIWVFSAGNVARSPSALSGI